MERTPRRRMDPQYRAVKTTNEQEDSFGMLLLSGDPSVPDRLPLPFPIPTEPRGHWLAGGNPICAWPGRVTGRRPACCPVGGAQSIPHTQPRRLKTARCRCCCAAVLSVQKYGEPILMSLPCRRIRSVPHNQWQKRSAVRPSVRATEGVWGRHGNAADRGVSHSSDLVDMNERRTEQSRATAVPLLGYKYGYQCESFVFPLFPFCSFYFLYIFLVLFLSARQLSSSPILPPSQKGKRLNKKQKEEGRKAYFAPTRQQRLRCVGAATRPVTRAGAPRPRPAPLQPVVEPSVSFRPHQPISGRGSWWCWRWRWR